MNPLKKKFNPTHLQIAFSDNSTQEMKNISSPKKKDIPKMKISHSLSGDKNSLPTLGYNKILYLMQDNHIFAKKYKNLEKKSNEQIKQLQNHAFIKGILATIISLLFFLTILTLYFLLSIPVISFIGPILGCIILIAFYFYIHDSTQNQINELLSKAYYTYICLTLHTLEDWDPLKIQQLSREKISWPELPEQLFSSSFKTIKTYLPKEKPEQQEQDQLSFGYPNYENFQKSLYSIHNLYSLDTCDKLITFIVLYNMKSPSSGDIPLKNEPTSFKE